MAEEIIRETISVTRTAISEEDKQVSAAYHRVVLAGLDHAMYVLAFGAPDEKLRIATAAMGSAARLAAVDSKAEIEEHRMELERVLDEITSVGETQTIITGPDAPPEYEFIDAPPLEPPATPNTITR
jgi:hypothetical protein